MVLCFVFICKKWYCARKENSKGEFRAVATQDDTFPDEFDDTYDDDDCGDVEEAWEKSGGSRVLEMSPIKNTKGSQNRIGGEEENARQINIVRYIGGLLLIGFAVFTNFNGFLIFGVSEIGLALYTGRQLRPTSTDESYTQTDED